MKYALFIATPSIEGKSNVSGFVSSFQNNVEQPEHTKQLVQCVWELDLKDGMQDLSTLVSLAKVHGLQSQVLFSEAEFSWVVTPVIKT
jgi:hypothetical protein